MTKECERQRWREAIFQSLAAEGNSNDRCIEVANKFDKMTEKGGMSNNGAAQIILSAYAATTDTKKVCRSIGDFVNSEMEFFTANHPGVETNSKIRIQQYAKRLNSLISQCSVTVDGQEIVSKEEIEKVKVKLPDCLTQNTYFAKGSMKEMAAHLVLEIRNLI